VTLRTGGNTYYLFLDPLGGTHITANSSGVQVGRLLYRPWGETRVLEGEPRTTRRFTGQREDATIGLYFYNARYYDPVLGRFIQADTIVPDPGDPQSLNRYSYVLNNPVTYRDPSGRCIPDLCPGVPTVEYPGSGTGLRGEAYAQWLYNLILWIDRERAATGGVYNVTSNLIQETAAHELNAFLMDDPEILGQQFYQELLMATPQLSAAAAGSGASLIISAGGPVLGAVRNTYRGGRYANLRGVPGIEVHHMPADSANPLLSRRDGPAIQMDAMDHLQTSSWGSGQAAQDYRAQISAYIASGQMRDAMAIEIRDIHTKFGSKYNMAIREMLDYTRSIGILTK
jgi:RHS repeat-associated protein